MSATIKDVSKDTGLSLATISKYLNNKSISKKNRALIEKSIKNLHYVPNRAAQALRSKISHSICIFMPDLSNYSFGYTCNCIVKHMKSHGFSTIVRRYSSMDAMQDIVFLKKRQVDGVVLFADTKYPSSLIFQLNTSGIPYVCMHQIPYIPSDFIGCNDAYAGKIVADYLYRHGHTRIALLGLDSSSSSQKIHGFLQASCSHGCNDKDLSIYLHSTSELLNMDYCDGVVNRIDQHTALVFLDHNTTLQMISNFIRPRSSQPIPSLLAFEDDDLFSAIKPALTVFAHDTQAIGSKASEILLKRIAGVFDDFPLACNIDPILIERESVKTVAPFDE